MSFRVSGKNIEIGAALQDHARAKVAAIIGKYFDTEVSGHVTLEPEGSGFRADMFVHLANGVTVQAEGRAHEAYACFDQAADRVEKRLRATSAASRTAIPPRLTTGRTPQPADVMASYVIETPARRRRHAGLLARRGRRGQGAASTPVGLGGGPGTRHVRCAACWSSDIRARPSQHRLSANRRPHRLDRPVGRRIGAGRPAVDTGLGTAIFQRCSAARMA